MARLADKICIITGAASGIGRASAEMFAREGASVVVTDLRAEAAEDVAHAISAAGGNARAMRVDVGLEADLERMIATTAADFGRIDVLYNNALYLNPEAAAKDIDFEAFDAQVFNDNMRVNTLGPALAIKHALPHMLKAGKGSIISTSSGSALGGDIAAFSYGASKAALNSLVQSVAVTYGKRGIRSNAILPGPVRTPALLSFATPEIEAAYREVVHVPQLAEPEDIAAMALFLASDESRYVNGALYSVDGGQAAAVPFAKITRMLLSGGKD